MVLATSPAQPIFRWRAAQQLAVLAYHGIDDADRFEQQVDYLHRKTHPVSLDEALGAIAGRVELPRHPVLVTFDDGHRSVVDVALPLLRDRQIPAVVFVVAGVVDTETPFWFAEVPELLRRGGSAQGLEGLDAAKAVAVLKRCSNEERVRL